MKLPAAFGPSAGSTVISILPFAVSIVTTRFAPVAAGGSDVGQLVPRAAGEPAGDAAGAIETCPPTALLGLPPAAPDASEASAKASELGLAPPPSLIAPPASATPIANTTTAPIAHHAVGMPPAADPPRVAPALARWVEGRVDRLAPLDVPPDWTARRFFDERGRGRFESDVK